MNRNIADLVNATAYDRDGEKLGSVKEVYINDSTGQPDFVEVGHGLFGMSSSIVPLRGHRLDGENLQLAFSKEHIKDAPDIDDDAHLSEEDHATIYRHFGLDGTPDSEVYERHVFEDDYAGDRFDHDRDLERDLRDAERHDLHDAELRGTDRDVPVTPPAPGTDVHGFGDYNRETDAPADRLRAESDRELGLDRTPEDRAARGTSAYGMSDEPREQYRDYETAERDYAKETRAHQNDDADRGRAEAEHDAREQRGVRLRRYRVQPVDDRVDPPMREQHDPRDLGNVDADGRPLDEGDEHIPRSRF
ncbi:hypothetical protein B842_11540 [Corynebacterium humireducens NBRC 106098 = DSM 45392]|uniref:PRC-barrel domain-containing protein n=1 Tax=Corynebacterium humireducens NBRC 106098 = DSM 45392 TaxID=1223515 RepID=A0A0B5D555_9CORY|nr:PRC-barrel domain-containing protein [Corynebacterium humireducens]AJE34155.1 hypothetical protein B842_11540 [Corynebacterium humireducens NBRC 106098 = DSM 45392]